jgi:hypothetical protein
VARVHDLEQARVDQLARRIEPDLAARAPHVLVVDVHELDDADRWRRAAHRASEVLGLRALTGISKDGTVVWVWAYRPSSTPVCRVVDDTLPHVPRQGARIQLTSVTPAGHIGGEFDQVICTEQMRAPLARGEVLQLADEDEPDLMPIRSEEQRALASAVAVGTGTTRDGTHARRARGIDEHAVCGDRSIGQ